MIAKLSLVSAFDPNNSRVNRKDAKNNKIDFKKNIPFKLI
jgi:hypothetical protein